MAMDTETDMIPLSGPTGTYSIYLPKGLSSGVYFLQMESQIYSRVVKVLLRSNFTDSIYSSQ
jgi:hypothetical protein